MKDRSFHDYIVHDLMGQIPGITSRAMFGGWGIYKGGVIFAIIVDGELYFKVDDSNRPEFKRMESRAFVYAKKGGKRITMSYWLVPEDVLEDQERLSELIDKSAAISRKGKARR